MINNAFGLIYADDSNTHLKELTAERSIAALPFGGRYRAIDFPLSNLVNTGITNVGVITQRNYNSLMDHVGGGAPWDLHRKKDGLYLLTPFFTRENTGFYRGNVDAIRGSIDYIEKVPYEYCIFMTTKTLYNTSYEKAMLEHKASGADITFLYNIEPPDKPAGPEILEEVRFVLNERGRIVDMEIDALRPKSPNCYMDCMILEKSLLLYLLDESAGRGYTDFIRDIVFRRLDTLKVYGFRYDDHVARVGSISSYFRENMALLKKEVRDDLFSPETPIYTKVKDEPPARYTCSAEVKNSMVADGCTIEGYVENCILFRGVRVDRGAKVRNCILIQGSEISEGAELENVILDKGVFVRRDRRLLGTENFPVVIRTNAVV